METLQEWKQISVLSVESSRVPRWSKPGLLLIGDAAHVISPIGGVGINYAIQDAVVAANVLTGPLQQGRVPVEALDAVQRQREWPTKVIQAGQNMLQERILKTGIVTGKTFKAPVILRLGFIRDFLARLIAFGVRRVQYQG